MFGGGGGGGWRLIFRFPEASCNWSKGQVCVVSKHLEF